MGIYQRIHGDTEPARAQTRCARGEHCAGTQPDDIGTQQAAWADPPLPFCRRDTGAITRIVCGFPERYVLLHMALGEKTRITDDRVSGSRTPPVPVRLDVDALIRDMILILCSWDELIADAEALTRPATWMSRYRRDQVAIPATVAALAPRLDIILKLPPVTMWRIIPTSQLEHVPAADVTTVNYIGGYAEILTELDGTAAGLEFFRLDYRCRRTLGQTFPPPAQLEGIPCRRCEMVALVRAAPPQTTAGREYFSECQECGQLMEVDEYRAWARQYAAWARQQVAAGELIPNDLPSYAKLAS